MTEVVYRQELKINCLNYQEKMDWACQQVDTAFLDGENIALTFYLDDSAQDYLKEKRQNSMLEKDIANLLIEQTRNKEWYQSICITIDDSILKQWSDGTLLTQDNLENIEMAYTLERHGFWTGPRLFENVLNPARAYSDYVLTFYGKIFDYFDFQDILGIVSVSISESYIEQLCAGSLAMEEATYMLIDYNGQVISSNNKELFSSTYAKYPELKKNISGKEGYFSISLNQQANVVFYEASEEYDWYLLSVVPEKSFTNGNRLSISIITLCIGLCIVFGICFGLVQKKTVIHPLTLLADKMSQTHSVESDHNEKEFSRDEIGMLYRAFVQMEHNIDEMIQKNYVSEIYRKEAEMQMLLSQINPHFLYNTLDSIYWLATQNRDYIVADQIATLSDIFRHTLKTGDEFTTLSSEIEFIGKYVNLMRVQTSNDIEFNVEIDEELMRQKIPKLLLQPLVENIFIHGIKEKRDYACIVISAEILNENLYITVGDNGVGVDEEKVRRELLDPERSNNAFALKNVNKRIQLIFGETYGLEFHSSIGNGTTVIIVLPQKI